MQLIFFGTVSIVVSPFRLSVVIVVVVRVVRGSEATVMRTALYLHFRHVRKRNYVTRRGVSASRGWDRTKERRFEYIRTFLRHVDWVVFLCELADLFSVTRPTAVLRRPAKCSRYGIIPKKSSTSGAWLLSAGQRILKTLRQVEDAWWHAQPRKDPNSGQRHGVEGVAAREGNEEELRDSEAIFLVDDDEIHTAALARHCRPNWLDKYH